MGSRNDSETGSSTRSFFRRPTPEGWDAFVERYGRSIYAWCRRKSLRPAEAEDVTQEVLFKIYRTIKSSPWNPNKGHLRPWLKTVVLNAIRDYLHDRDRAGRVADWLDAVAADQENVVEELVEEEIRQIAVEHTQIRVDAVKWTVFTRRVYDGKKAPEVARELGLAVGTVYNYLSEVSAVLRHELEALQ